MEINEKIKYIRNEFNYNQREFASILNIAQSTVSRVELGEREPEYKLLKALFEKLQVNPEWIFLDKGPKFLEIDQIHSNAVKVELLNDINLIFTPEDLYPQISNILFKKIYDEIFQDEDDKYGLILKKLFDTSKLSRNLPFRPLIFVYYIFKYIQKFNYELKDVESFKSYLINLVNRYNIITFRNNPTYTKEIKEEIIFAIDFTIGEEECKTLFLNYDNIIKQIESKMTNKLIYIFKNINIETLFPKA